MRVAASSWFKCTAEFWCDLSIFRQVVHFYLYRNAFRDVRERALSLAFFWILRWKLLEMRAVVMLCTSCRRHRLCVSVFRCCVFGCCFWAEKGQKGNLFTLRNLNNERSIRILATKEFQLNLVLFRRVFALVRYDSTKRREKNAGAVAKQSKRFTFFRERINVILILILLFLWSPPIFHHLVDEKCYCI